MSPAACQPMEAIGAGIRRRLAGFVRTLRDNGFALGLKETGDALAILASPLAARPATLQPALKALFSATRSDWERFDEIFQAYWLGRGLRRQQMLTGTASDGSRPQRRLPSPLAGNDAAIKQNYAKFAEFYSAYTKRVGKVIPAP